LAVAAIEIQRIVELHLAGKNNMEIANELDLHRQTVRRQLAKSDVAEVVGEHRTRH